MTAPEVDSLWIDNDPRTTLTRYVLVTGPPDGKGKVPCISWYDLTGGTHDARPSKNRIERFQPQRNGNWSHSGFRPAEAGPALGYPYGYGPDADQFTGSDA
jgi:hypothetical protein